LGTRRCLPFHHYFIFGGWGGFAPAAVPELHQARYYLRNSTIFDEVDGIRTRTLNLSARLYW